MYLCKIFVVFSVYKQEYHRLRTGLFPEDIMPLEKSHPPLWTKDDFIKVMKTFVKSQGYVLDDDLIEKIGHGKVYSILKYNFLHIRPTSNFYYDIANPPQEEKILTPINQTMENLLKKVF